MRLYVTTTIEQYNITLNLSGPMDRLRTNYTSEPSLTAGRHRSLAGIRQDIRGSGSGTLIIGSHGCRIGAGARCQQPGCRETRKCDWRLSIDN